MESEPHCVDIEIPQGSAGADANSVVISARNIDELFAKVSFNAEIMNMYYKRNSLCLYISKLIMNFVSTSTVYRRFYTQVCK